MARPRKEGLDYFPLDVHFDEKIEALESLHKNDGLVWIIKFWQKAYSTNEGNVNLNGIFGIIQAENCRITPQKQAEIIRDCLEIHLIREVEPGIYTSNGIQKRLDEVVKERESERKRKFSGSFPAENTPETGERKGKESKVKESKENKNYIMSEIISDLNEILKTSYKPTSAKTQELIQARLNEGFTLEDFKIVHRNMAKKWGPDNKMREFLRPITLYSNKFESYLNIQPDLPMSTNAAKSMQATQEWLKQKEVIDVGQK